MQITKILSEGEPTWPSQRVMFGVGFGEHSVVYGCHTCPAWLGLTVVCAESEDCVSIGSWKEDVSDSSFSKAVNATKKSDHDL